MMFIYKTDKFAPIWTTTLKIRTIFVHQTVTEHALCNKNTKESDMNTKESDMNTKESDMNTKEPVRQIASCGPIVCSMGFGRVSSQ